MDRKPFEKQGEERLVRPFLRSIATTDFLLKLWVLRAWVAIPRPGL